MMMINNKDDNNFLTNIKKLKLFADHCPWQCMSKVIKICEVGLIMHNYPNN